MYGRVKSKRMNEQCCRMIRITCSVGRSREAMDGRLALDFCSACAASTVEITLVSGAFFVVASAVERTPGDSKG
jgi:hypothetical protein